MSMFGSGPRSNILETVAPMYQGIVNAEKQKGEAMRTAMGAFGQAIDPKTIGMNKFKKEFANADWSKPETFMRAGRQLMQTDPNAALGFIQKGQEMTAAMAPKTSEYVTATRFVDGVEMHGSMNKNTGAFTSFGGGGKPAKETVPKTVKINTVDDKGKPVTKIVTEKQALELGTFAAQPSTTTDKSTSGKLKALDKTLSMLASQHQNKTLTDEQYDERVAFARKEAGLDAFSNYRDYTLKDGSRIESYTKEGTAGRFYTDAAGNEQRLPAGAVSTPTRTQEVGTPALVFHKLVTEAADTLERNPAFKKANEAWSAALMAEEAFKTGQPKEQQAAAQAILTNFDPKGNTFKSVENVLKASGFVGGIKEFASKFFTGTLDADGQDQIWDFIQIVKQQVAYDNTDAIAQFTKRYSDALPKGYDQGMFESKLRTTVSTDMLSFQDSMPKKGSKKEINGVWYEFTGDIYARNTRNWTPTTAPSQ